MVTIQATMNDVDFSMVQALFKRLKIHTIVLDKKREYPIETAVPNEETHKAFMEVKEKGHLLKRYKNVKELFEDIENE